jgi:hypothetical protein
MAQTRMAIPRSYSPTSVSNGIRDFTQPIFVSMEIDCAHYGDVTRSWRNRRVSKFVGIMREESEEEIVPPPPSRESPRSI